LVQTNDERASKLRSRGVEVAIGDVRSIGDVRAALTGIGAAYFIYPIQPGLIDATAYFAQAACEAGVSAIVNMSQISARAEAKSHAALNHWISERIFDWFGIPVTHLRPTFFANWLTYPHFAQYVSRDKVIAFPFERARHAPIAAEDLGRFIAALLADPAPHAGKIYPLRGPIEMNHDEIANAIGEVLGFEVRYVPLEIDEFRLRLERDLQFPPFMVQHLCEVALDYRNGIFGGTDDIIERVTGEAPMTVQAFISHHKDAFSGT
jgi:uncharacterized protein YbjT (DUF2867 family)